MLLGRCRNFVEPTVLFLPLPVPPTNHWCVYECFVPHFAQLEVYSLLNLDVVASVLRQCFTHQWSHLLSYQSSSHRVLWARVARGRTQSRTMGLCQRWEPLTKYSIKSSKETQRWEPLNSAQSARKGEGNADPDQSSHRNTGFGWPNSKIPFYLKN